MDQLIFASLSQTHYWYEVGMLKVPAGYYILQHRSLAMQIHKNASITAYAHNNFMSVYFRVDNFINIQYSNSGILQY